MAKRTPQEKKQKQNKKKNTKKQNIYVITHLNCFEHFKWMWQSGHGWEGADR